MFSYLTLSASLNSVKFQHLLEAVVPLMKEKEKLLQDYEDLKLKLDREYDEHAENKRGFQQDIEMLMTLNNRIKECV